MHVEANLGDLRRTVQRPAAVRRMTLHKARTKWPKATSHSRNNLETQAPRLRGPGRRKMASLRPRNGRHARDNIVGTPDAMWVSSALADRAEWYQPFVEALGHEESLPSLPSAC